MRQTVKRLALALLLTTGASASQAPAAELKHWPLAAAEKLQAVIAANANSGAYAVFDMDNTGYRYDLEESLFPFLGDEGRVE